MGIDTRYPGGMGVGESAKSPERCKPDYEAIIKRLNQELAETDEALNYLQALNNLNINIPGDGSMIQITGALYLRQSTLKKAIALKIKEQEEDK